jgi:GTP cyclohydrolase I
VPRGSGGRGRVDGTSALLEAPDRELDADDRERFARNLGEIFVALGMDPATPGTRGTPERHLAALEDATAGYRGDAKLATTFPNEDDTPHERAADQVVEGPIRFYALCEHHALPFFGDAFVGYLPADELLGLSKITRLVRLHARRFTMQERLAADVAADLERLVGARGVAVRVEARHLCTQMRGVSETESATRTTVFRGRYESAPELRAEFLRLCDRADSP